MHFLRKGQETAEERRAREAREADREALEQFEAGGDGVPLSEVRAWVDSWDTPDELPEPQPRPLDGPSPIVRF